MGWPAAAMTMPWLAVGWWVKVWWVKERLWGANAAPNPGGPTVSHARRVARPKRTLLV